jgi:glycosyltransferase involved in cell wall biosynthesis
VLRHLAERGHRITLATFVRPDEEQFLHALRDICAEVHPIPLTRSRLSDLGYLIQGYLKGVPFLVERDNLPEMRALVNRITDSGSVDIIHADQFTMAQFSLRQTRTVPRIYDAHNATWKLVERTAANFPRPLRWLMGREIDLMKTYERSVIRSFEHTFTVTPIDKDFLLELFQEDKSAISAQITSTPISVDCDKLQPVQRKSGSHHLVTLGTLHYPPNADGIRWFFNEVLPLVRQVLPDARLTIIGKNPPADFIAAAQQQPEVLTVTGYVPDLLPYFQDAAAIVVPVRSGGGMRVRILEAFAYGMPVLTTTAGLEGIDAANNTDVIVRDTPEDLAQAVCDLLKDPTQQEILAQNGRKLAEEKYHWKVALRMLDQVYERLVPTGKPE